MHPLQHKHPLASSIQSKANQEGIIVWDPKGIVIMWHDGHRSRFFWQGLRANCSCKDCQPHRSSHTDSIKLEAA
jgi:DUF971 family protein